MVKEYLQTEEAKKKRRETMKRKFANGELKIWNKGTKGLMNFSNEHNEKIRLHRIGKKHRVESIKIMRERKIGKKASQEQIDKFKRWRRTQVSPIKDTSIEIKIQSFLRQLGITFFTHQYIKEIEHGYQCDILIPSMNLVIECDGDYWHKYPIGNDIDHIRTSGLLAKGFKVLRLWESDIKKMSFQDFKNKFEVK